jgi:hypothetical protein
MLTTLHRWRLLGLALAGILLVAAWRFWPRSHTLRGRLLCAAEMAAIFGDATANNLCASQQNCLCTRQGFDTGVPLCVYCDNVNGDGKNTPWTLCCPGVGKYCNEAGNPACANLFYYTSAQFEQANDCCRPCRPLNPQPTQTPCQRNNADNQSQGC